MRSIRFIFAALLLLPETAAAKEFSWQLQRDSEDIQVFTRPVEGSPLLEFKAVTVVDAPLEEAAALYENAGRMTEWFHRCKEARVLEQSPEADVIYFAADLPWPLSDRDGVYRRVKAAKADGSVEYRMHSERGAYPLQKGRVRVTYLDAAWHLIPLPDGRTRIEYRMHTAAGGFIPAPLVNRFSVSLPFKTLKKFRAALEKNRE